MFTLIAVGVLAFVFVKQFLVNKDSSSGTPPLTKSMLDIPDISQPSPAVRQTALNQYKQSKPAPPPKSTTTPIKPPKPTTPIKPPPIVKPVTLKTPKPPAKADDDKGKHFEVRV